MITAFNSVPYDSKLIWGGAGLLLTCVPFRDQSLNPNTSHPCLIYIPTSTLCLVLMLTPAFISFSILKIPVPPLAALQPRSQPHRLGSPPGRGQTDQNQSQVDQLSPTATGGMCSVSPDYPVWVSADGCSCQWHSGCWWNGIIYLPSSLLLSPEGRSARMCTGLLFTAGIHSK